MTIEDLKQAAQEQISPNDRQALMFAMPMGPIEAATRGMETIANLVDATITEAAQSAKTYKGVLDKVEGYRRLLNGLAAEHLGFRGGRKLVTEGGELIDERTGHLREERLTARDREVLKKANEAARDHAFLHWDIDFPDVFFSPSRLPAKRAFDAVVGNPPYGYRVLDRREKEAIETILGPAESENIVEHFIVRGFRLVGSNHSCGLVVPKQLTYAITWGRLRSLVLDNTSVRGLVDVSEAFEEVLLEQVVVIMGPKYPKNYNIPVYWYGESGLEYAGELDSRLCSKRLFPLYSTGAVGGLVAKVLQRSTPTNEHYSIINGLKNVRDHIGEHDGHPCLVGDNVGRYELIPPVLRIKKTVLTPGIRARLCRPKVLSQQVVAHLTNPVPYVRIPAMFDPSDSALFETAIAFIPKNQASSTTRMLSLLGLLNSSLTYWFMYNYAYNRSVRTMHFTEDYSGIVPLPRSWAGTNSNPGMEELATFARESSLLGEAKQQLHQELVVTLRKLLETVSVEEFSGKTKLQNIDYMGWEDRFGGSPPPEEVNPQDGGPDNIPRYLIARVYPSYPLPSIDAAAWEAAAWEELCDLLRKNKGKIGDARIRADLTGRGAVANPTGPLRRLRDTFLDYHRKVRANRTRAAEIDFLIDRIVFRLFELTPDEQKLILSRVGPGRPLPPRRRRRAR